MLSKLYYSFYSEFNRVWPYPFEPHFGPWEEQVFWGSTNIQIISWIDNVLQVSCDLEWDEYIYFIVKSNTTAGGLLRFWNFHFNQLTGNHPFKYQVSVRFTDPDDPPQQHWYIEWQPQDLFVPTAHFASAGTFLPPVPEVLDWIDVYTSEYISVPAPPVPLPLYILYRFKPVRLGGLSTSIATWKFLKLPCSNVLQPASC